MDRADRGLTPPPLPTALRPASNCGLIKAIRSPSAFSVALRRGEHFEQGDEGDVHDDHVDRGEIARLDVAEIGPLDDDHSRVLPELPIELAIADVDGVHLLRAPLQEAIGKASRSKRRHQCNAGRRRRRQSDPARAGA